MSSENAWISTSDLYLAPRVPGNGDAWPEEAGGRGRRGTQRIVAAGEAPAPPEVAAAFQVSPGTQVVTRKRVMYLDEEPVELTDTYYPAFIARGTPLAEPRKIKGGAVTYLAQLGHTADRVREDVTARLATPEEQAGLHLPDGAPVLVLHRLSIGNDGQPIQFDTMTMPASQRTLRYEMKAQRT